MSSEIDSILAWLREEAAWREAELKEAYGIDDKELLLVYVSDIYHVPVSKGRTYP